MQYITTYYRTQGEGAPSLVLLSFLYRNIPVCFACVSQGREDRSGDWARQLAESARAWSDSCDWIGIVRAMRRQPEAVKKRIEEQVLMPCWGKEAGDRAAWGILLCVGTGLLVMGEQLPVYQVMNFYGRGRVERLRGYGVGQMEPGVGILLSSKELPLAAWRERLGDCFRFGAIRGEESATGRLRELASGLQGEGEPVTMVLLMTGDRQ